MNPFSLLIRCPAPLSQPHISMMSLQSWTSAHLSEALASDWGGGGVSYSNPGFPSPAPGPRALGGLEVRVPTLGASQRLDSENHKTFLWNNQGCHSRFSVFSCASSAENALADHSKQRTVQPPPQGTRPELKGHMKHAHCLTGPHMVKAGLNMLTVLQEVPENGC